MGLTALERETMITFNDAEDMAQVFTHQRRVITKLKKNSQAVLLGEGVFEGTSWARFEIPANLLSFRTGRRKPTAGSGQGFRSQKRALENAS